MSTDFQEVFNLNKGSIPVRLGMKLDKFDDCAKTSAADFVSTAKAGALVPSIAHGMAVPSAAEGAIKDVVSQFWNDDKMTLGRGHGQARRRREDQVSPPERGRFTPAAFRVILPARRRLDAALSSRGPHHEHDDCHARARGEHGRARLDGHAAVGMDAQARAGALLPARLLLHLRPDGLERLSVAVGLAAAAELRVRRPRSSTRRCGRATAGGSR